MNEVSDFHPLVERWLTDHGYTVSHHEKLPFSGIADFVARKGDEVIIVEAKAIAGNVQHAIRQVKGYQWQISNACAAVAIPEQWVSPGLISTCGYAGVSLIGIECPDNLLVIDKPRRVFQTNSMCQHIIDNLVWIDSLIIYAAKPTDVLEKLYAVSQHDIDRLLFGCVYAMCAADVYIDYCKLTGLALGEKHLEYAFTVYETVIEELYTSPEHIEQLYAECCSLLSRHEVIDLLSGDKLLGPTAIQGALQ